MPTPPKEEPNAASTLPCSSEPASTPDWYSTAGKLALSCFFVLMLMFIVDKTRRSAQQPRSYAGLKHRPLNNPFVPYQYNNPPGGVDLTGVADAKGRLAVAWYRGDEKLDLGLCATVFASNMECKDGASCKWRHKLPESDDMKYFKERCPAKKYRSLRQWYKSPELPIENTKWDASQFK